MKLLVFGATGLVGRCLVREALMLGHEVTAFGRQVFTTNYPPHEQLRLVEGALFDAKEVKQALLGQDAVLSALGGGTDGTDFTRSLGIKNICQQMKTVGLSRIVAVGGEGILEDAEGKLLMQDEDYPEAYKAVSQEHWKAYQHLVESALEWTMVCPPYIPDREATGVYRTAASMPPEGSTHTINNGDLALFMINELSRNEYVHQRVGITN